MTSGAGLGLVDGGGDGALEGVDAGGELTVPPVGLELGLASGVVCAAGLVWIGELLAVVVDCVQAAASSKSAARDAVARQPEFIAVVRSVVEAELLREGLLITSADDQRCSCLGDGARAVSLRGQPQLKRPTLMATGFESVAAHAEVSVSTRVTVSL